MQQSIQLAFLNRQTLIPFSSSHISAYNLYPFAYQFTFQSNSKEDIASPYQLLLAYQSIFKNLIIQYGKTAQDMIINISLLQLLKNHDQGQLIKLVNLFMILSEFHEQSILLLHPLFDSEFKNNEFQFIKFDSGNILGFMETMDLLEKDNLELNQKYNETELQLKQNMKNLESVQLQCEYLKDQIMRLEKRIVQLEDELYIEKEKMEMYDELNFKNEDQYFQILSLTKRLEDFEMHQQFQITQIIPQKKPIKLNFRTQYNIFIEPVICLKDELEQGNQIKKLQIKQLYTIELERSQEIKPPNKKYVENKIKDLLLEKNNQIVQLSSAIIELKAKYQNLQKLIS